MLGGWIPQQFPSPPPSPMLAPLLKKNTKLLRSPPQKLKIHRKEEVEEGYRNSTLPQQNCIISGDTNPKFNNPPPKNPPQGSGGGLHKFHSLAKIEFQEIQCPDDYDGVVIESSTPPKGALILNLLNFSPCKNTFCSISTPLQEYVANLNCFFLGQFFSPLLCVACFISHPSRLPSNSSSTSPHGSDLNSTNFVALKTLSSNPTYPKKLTTLIEPSFFLFTVAVPLRSIAEVICKSKRHNVR